VELLAGVKLLMCIIMQQGPKSVNF